MRFVVSYVVVVFRNFFAIDTRYELIVGGHIYALQPVVVMLQAPFPQRELDHTDQVYICPEC